MGLKVYNFSCGECRVVGSRLLRPRRGCSENRALGRCNGKKAPHVFYQHYTSIGPSATLGILNSNLQSVPALLRALKLLHFYAFHASVTSSLRSVGTILMFQMARRVLFLASFAAAAADDHSASLPRRTTDTNLVTDDAGNEGGRHDYDKHGCDVAEGTYWCAIKNRCVTTWETCESLIGYNDQCTAMWSGLSWDLSALKGQVFTITDAVNTNPSYAYAFSVCGNVDLDKTGFTDSLKRTCGSTTGTAGETMTDPSPVYQVVDGTMCKRAGVDQSGSNKERFIRGNQMEWGLLDPLNPAMGLELTYTGGNTCKENQFQAAGSCDYKGSDGKSYCERGMKIRMVRCGAARRSALLHWGS